MSSGPAGTPAPGGVPRSGSDSGEGAGSGSASDAGPGSRPGSASGPGSGSASGELMHSIQPEPCPCGKFLASEAKALGWARVIALPQPLLPVGHRLLHQRLAEVPHQAAAAVRVVHDGREGVDEPVHVL